MPKIVIDVRLDPVPGWGNTIEDFLSYFTKDCGIHHYIESVEVQSDTQVVVIRKKEGLVLHGVFPNMESAQEAVSSFREKCKEYSQYDFSYIEIQSGDHTGKLIQ